MTELSDRFPRWLRDVNLDPGASRQGAMLSAARSISEQEGRLAWDLVLLAHGVDSDDAFDRVSSALRAEDETWDVRKGDLEVVLTAAAAVAYGLQADPRIAVPLGMAMRSASFAGLDCPVDDLPALARIGLIDASERLRARGTLAVGTPDIKGAMAEAGDFSQPVGVDGAVVQRIVAATEKAATRAATPTVRLVRLLNARLAATEEELDVLWWAFGESSELLQQPFKTVGAGAVALVVGMEMAQRTATLQCPLPSARALMARLMGAKANKSISIQSAVPATQKRLSETWQPSARGHRLLPISSSAAEYRELSGNAAWRESVGRWGIDPSRETTNLELAEQMLNETLLLTYDE